MDDYYDIPKRKCPDDCLRYTERRWYFVDESKQEKYFKDKVEKCEKELKECRNKNKEEFWLCWDYCDEYWEKVKNVN